MPCPHIHILHRKGHYAAVAPMLDLADSPSMGALRHDVIYSARAINDSASPKKYVKVKDVKHRMRFYKSHDLPSPAGVRVAAHAGTRDAMVVDSWWHLALKPQHFVVPLPRHHLYFLHHRIEAKLRILKRRSAAGSRTKARKFCHTLPDGQTKNR